MKKQSFKKRIYKILLIILSLGTVYSFAYPKFLNPSTAYAIGDLTINWGVPTGNPIFVVTNMMPGDIESRSVIITNNASSSRPVAVRADPTSDLDNLSSVMDFVVFDGVVPVYGAGSPTGDKTLADFFLESDPISGIPLSILGPGATTTYTFVATFDESAGNPFQGTSVIFDLIIGIGFEVPAQCQNITFSGDPIFGTSGNDNIKGTNYNDLIILFEGDDKANGSNGDDCIIGNEGNDKLNGSNGKDVVFGNEDNDNLDGSNGDDLLFGGTGDDKIFGTNGNDRIFAEEGDDKVEASNGDDYAILGSGNDEIDAGNGNDYIEGNEGNDKMRGRNGNDTIIGGADIDEARGDLGTDTCDAETEVSCEI